MSESTDTAAPRAGRPPKLDEHGTPTRERLVQAAIAACVEHGYEGATLSDIAQRAGVSTPAVYGYFAGKDELMLIAARDAFENITTHPEGTDGAGIVRAWMSEDAVDERRMLLELHRAAGRHHELRQLIDEWAREQSRVLRQLGLGPVRIKLVFLVMFGLLHLEDIDGLEADHDGLVDDAVALVNGLVGLPRG